MKRNSLRPQKDNKELYDPQVPYLNEINVLMYLANNRQPDIAFFMNSLSRYNSSPTRRHWNAIKKIFSLPTRNYGYKLFHSNNVNH